MLTQRTPNITTHRAVELVDAVEGRIRGYVFIWGDPENRDSFRTWFDRTRPPEMSLDFAPWPLHYEHAQDGAIQQDIVGKIDSVEFDAIGCRFEASLYRDAPFFGRIVGELKQQKLKTSSATTPHLAEFDDEGRFKHWELSEVSLTATPSESRMPAVEILRSAEQGRNAAGASDDSLNTNLTEPRNMETIMTDFVPAPEAQRASLEEILKMAADAGYSAEDIMAALQAMSAPQEPRAEDSKEEDEEDPTMRSITAASLLAYLKSQKEQSELETLRAENAALKAKRNAAPQPQPRSAHQPAPSVSVSEPRKFWGRSDSDLMFVQQILKARKETPSEDLIQTLAGRAARAIEKHDPLIDNPVVRSALKGTRSDEIVTSTNTGNGDERIGVAYSSTLWEKARDNRIYQELVSKGMIVEEVPPGYESTVIFTESTDPTVYTITQSADLDATLRPTVVVPVTAPGTGQVTMTPGYLGMAVAYTSVFEEDSLINASCKLNRQMNEKAEETIEQLFINGDTASSANVNYDGGTANAAQYFLASNGARKYALVTGSSTSRSGGTLDEDDFRLTLKLFPSAIRTRKGQMAFIIDSDIHNTALGISAIKTEDVRRTNATIVSGLLENIYGVDVFESGFMPLTDTDGKVTYNAAGTVGTILGVYAPYWAMGWKRRVTFETSKDILAQSNLIVATFRLGFLARGAGAAVASYNLTVA